MKKDLSYSSQMLQALIEQELNKGTLAFDEMGVEGSFVKDAYQRKRDLLKGKRGVTDFVGRRALEQAIKDADEEIAKLIEDISTKTSDELAEGKFVPNLKVTTAKGCDVLTCADFVSKMLAKKIKDDVRAIYKYYPAERNEVLAQLKGVLGEGVARFVVRTDIHHFFESIDQNYLLHKLSEERLLPPLTEKYLRAFLYQYNRLMNNGEPLGLPRGMAFSSYLSELYLHDIDRHIKRLPGVYFYARYVDDIIIVCVPEKDVKSKDFYAESLHTILSKRNLSLNDKKTTVIDTQEGQSYSFEYLGYRLLVEDRGCVEVLLSDNKVEKYKFHISNCINHYNRVALCHTKGKTSPLRELICQLNVVATNGRLQGRKSHVNTGIYYSNSALTSTRQLAELDDFLAQCLQVKLSIPRHPFLLTGPGYEANRQKTIKTILRKCSFVQGFSHRRLFRGSAQAYLTTAKSLRIIYETEA